VGQVFNIGTTNEISILDLARRVIQTVRIANGGSAGSKGKADPVVFVPYQEAYQTDFEDMLRRVPETSKIRRFIGWEPRLSLEQTLADIVTELTEAGLPKD
jgi:UDP-glucose 4-epimerase